MENKASKNLSLFIVVSGLVFVINILTYTVRSFSTISKLFGIPPVVLLLIAVFIFLVLVGLAIITWRSTIVYRWIQRLFDNARGYWGILLLLNSGLFVEMLVYVSFTFASFRPIFIMAFVTFGLIIIKLVYSANKDLRLLFVGLSVFIVEVPILISIQKFLFPLESYWILLFSGLFLYVVIEWLLIKGSLISNLFIALDIGHARLVDTLPLVIYPLIISSLLSLTGQGMFVFFLPIFWLICLVHSCLTALISYLIEYFRHFQFTANHKLWLIGIFSVLLVYSLAFFSQKTYPPSYPLFEGGNATQGTWFTIPVEKSELFPFGYARLEDSISDDLGKPFFAALGQTLGLVANCKLPGPDTSVSLPSPEPNRTIQPKYTYAVDSMCTKWTDTLPVFFWRIGITGIILLSFVFGCFIAKDPFDFVFISLLLLFGWYTWPISDNVRVGDVAAIISGMPFIGLILPLFRRKKYSYLISWGLFSGFIFGLASFVRQPCGYALMVTSTIVLIYVGFHQKRILLALTTSVALLIGSSLIPATLNGLFLYRDMKLQISAPSISPRVHGAGLALLSGIGGSWYNDPSSYEYKNSLDIAFKDSLAWFNLYNENPMISFSEGSIEMMMKTAQKMFVHYVTTHPIEFGLITLKKAYTTFILMFKVPKNWPSISLLLLFVLCLRYCIHRFIFPSTNSSGKKLGELLLVFIILLCVAALPPILTAPNYAYGQTTYPSAAVLFFTVTFAAYMLIKRYFFKSSSRED